MLTQIFCEVDDICNEFTPILNKHMLATGIKRRHRKGNLSLSEIMTILIYFHLSRYRDFKAYYQRFILGEQAKAFPNAVSYARFITLLKGAWLPMGVYLNSRCLGAVTGISFIDSASLPVCHNLRINSNKVFRGVAARGKTSTGWFYGFKIHLTVNDRGEILSSALSSGNTDDRNWKIVNALTRRLFGKLFADKGYLSKKLSHALRKRDIQLITKLRKNMKNQLMPLLDKLLLRKRAIIESVIDLLKNVCQIQHSRHRSVTSFAIHLLAGLAAYSFLPKKPSLNLTDNEIKALAPV